MRLGKSTTGSIFALCLLLASLTLEAKAKCDWGPFLAKRFAWNVSVGDGRLCWSESVIAFHIQPCQWCQCNEPPGCAWLPDPPPYLCLTQDKPPWLPDIIDDCFESTETHVCFFSIAWRYCYDLSCLQDYGGCIYGLTPRGIPDVRGLIWLSPHPLLNPDTSTCDSTRYFPRYNDTLTYVISVTHPMKVIVVVKASTYEGMAMNAPVPAGADTISDIVPVFLPGDPWQQVATYFEGARRCFKLRGELEAKDGAGRPRVYLLHLRVLDYAAEGFVMAYEEGDSTNIARSPRWIPNNTDFAARFRTSADPDSDGLTRWEEYRGFVISGSHRRLTDTLVSSPDHRTNHWDVFVNNEDGMPDRCVPLIVEKAGLDSIVSYAGEVRDGRFMDFMCRVRADTGWARNPVVEPDSTKWWVPGHTPENNEDWQFGRINVINAVLPYGVFGQTSKVSGDTTAAGGGHVIHVEISYENIHEKATDWADTNSGYFRCFPGTANSGDIGFFNQFCDSAWIRTGVHEFGHVFGLMHFTPEPDDGPGSCAMTYIYTPTFLPICNGQVSWGDFLQWYLYPTHYSYEGSPNWPMIFRPRPH